MPTRRRLLATVGAAVTAGCGSTESDDGSERASPTETATSGSLSISSSALDDGEAIPERFTADGANLSPPLDVAGVPDGVAVLALLVDDPDAPDPPFTHWLAWNVPPAIDGIPEGVPPEEEAPSLGGARQGTNDAGTTGYHGPDPPEGDPPHTYRFTVLALEDGLSLPAGADRGAFDAAVDGVVVARDALTGTYAR